MPTSKHRKNRTNRSPKSSRRPVKTTEIAPKTHLPVSIQPPDPPPALLESEEMKGNEREIDFSGLSPRQQTALPIVACFPSVARAARAANVGESTLYRWLADPAFSACLAELRRQTANVARQRLLELVPLSLSVLADAMDDANPAIRLRAANYALSFNLRAAEHEDFRSGLNDLQDAINDLKSTA